MPIPLQFASFHWSQEVFIWRDGFCILIGYVISVRDTEEFAEASYLQQHSYIHKHAQNSTILQAQLTTLQAPSHHLNTLIYTQSIFLCTIQHTISTQYKTLLHKHAAVSTGVLFHSFRQRVPDIQSCWTVPCLTWLWCYCGYGVTAASQRFCLLHLLLRQCRSCMLLIFALRRLATLCESDDDFVLEFAKSAIYLAV